MLNRSDNLEKYVNYSANIFLGVTLVSIATIFAGFVKNAAFPSTGPDATHVCLLGPRLLQQPEDQRCAGKRSQISDNRCKQINSFSE
jgi:hypothetical protein